MELNLSLVFIIILGGGWLFGRLFERLKLPGVMGMVVFGILCSLLIKTQTTPTLWDIAPYLKSFALIIILLRAGLGIKKATLKKYGLTAILLSFVPCIFEGLSLSVLFHYLFGFSWSISGLTAFMLAAVSPAVVVPSMLNLIEKENSEVPTIILAGASIDDVFAITIFTIFLQFSQHGSVNILESLISVPLSIFWGILSGLFFGYFLSIFLKRNGVNIRATEKTLILLVFGVLLFQIGEIYHFASLLGVMTIGFILLARNEKIAQELASKFAKLWIFAEIILFVLIGFSLNISDAVNAGFKGLFIISIGLIFRSIGVYIATIPSQLTAKERLFCMIAYLPKATVQAALGGVALAYGLPGGEIILALAVIAILFTAPIGLIGINYFGSRLLGSSSKK